MGEGGDAKIRDGEGADFPFRQLAQNLAVPCWISDEIGRILWVNDAWFSYTGRSVEQIKAAGLKPLHDPKVYGDVVRKWAAVMASGKADEMVFPLRGKDGRLRPFLTRVVPLRDETGRITRWFGTNTDVSDQLETVARLQSSEEKWREVFERAGEGIFLTDRDGALTEVNDAACAIAGYCREELIGRSVFDLIEPDQQPDLAAARSRDESVGDWRLRRRDGSIAYLEISSRRLSDGGRLGVARDVSARRAAEAALTSEAAEQRQRADEAERHARHFWEASRDLFAVVSATDGLPRLINGRAWHAALGYSEQALLKTRLFDLVHPEDVERTWAMRRAHRQADYFGFENRLLAKDGREVWFSWNIVREGDLTYCSARDITDEKRAREDLLQANARLARAQKMETIGQLTGGLAHDFNNLLMVVSGHAELLANRVGADARAAQSLDAIATASRRGQELTRRLLAFSRRQRLKPMPISLSAQVCQLQPLLASSLGRAVELRLDCPLDLWTIEVDPSELEAVILNLAVNSRDAMPNGGRFSVAARNVVVEEAVGKDELQPGRYVEIEVSDDGQGIPPDILEKVVEPYFTTKDIHRGTGLGLSQVDGFVQQSGGRLHIESALGEGTTVRIWLPTVDLAPAPPLGPPAPATTSELSVLLVEDNPDVAEVTAGLLEQLGHTVAIAGSASVAEEMLDSWQGPPPDLVLSDIVMAGDLNGLALARRLKQKLPNLPVILVTGYSREAEAIGDEFPVLAKPYQLADLSQALRGVAVAGLTARL